MSKILGRTLDGRLLRYLRGSRLSKGKVIMIATSGPDGWPHLAMLSSSEVFARDRSNISMATYESSRTTKNLRRNGVVTLIVQDRGLACYVEGKASLIKKSAASDPGNSIFNVRVTRVLEDVMAGTRITGGVTFRKDAGVEPHGELYDELARI